MPSIIEVDTIKNKTGTQNTVLSTDGSGNNTLNAGVIKSNTGSNTGLTIASDGQITVNQNNPTLTLGANTTFPTKVTDKTYFYQAEVRNQNSNANYHNYISASSLNGGLSAKANAVIPSNITSIQNVSLWWISPGTDVYTVNFLSSASANDELKNNNDLSATAFLSSTSRTGEKVYKEDLTAIGAISTYFSSNVSAGDVVALMITEAHSPGRNFYALGFEITYRF